MKKKPYSFFSKLTAEELWKGALAETGVEERKRRCKRTKRKKKKNLNKGQIIIEKCSGFVWFGLNVPFMKSGIAKTTDQRCKEEQEMVEAGMT